jgi:transcriptional regulator with XRE-family HTH domain
MSNDPEFHHRLGLAVRNRRIARGISQEVLGAHLGVTFQQQQKYERGINRITVCNLIKTAQLLGCNETDIIDDAREHPASDDNLLIKTINAIRGLSAEHLLEVRKFIRSLAAEAN